MNKRSETLKGGSGLGGFWGLIIFLVAIGFGIYWLGKISAQFDANICYSNVVNELTDEIGRVARSPSPGEDARSLEAKARALPVYGYESDCQEMLEALRR